MTTRKHITKVSIVLAVAIFGLAFTTAVDAASITINNSDFGNGSDGTVSAGGASISAVNSWTEEDGTGERVHTNTDWQAEGDRVLYLSAVAGVNQDLAHNWAADETFSLSFKAWEAGWQNPDLSATANGINVELKEVDGTVLWSSGFIALDGTHAGAEGSIINGATSHDFSFNIDASLFAGAGVDEGDPLNIRFFSTAASSADFVDDVALSVSLPTAPEPNTLVLAGLAMVGLAVRRRRKR